MKRRLVTLVSTVLLATAMSAAEVRLVLDEQVVLPGTPTGVSVFVRNTDAKKTLKLPPMLWLTATDANFETFAVRAVGLAGHLTGQAIPEDQRTIAPGASREFRYDPSVVVLGSPWFGDERITSPGQYRLRAVFAPEIGVDGAFNAQHGFASKEEPITVAVNAEDDAAVWAWMQKRGKGVWGDGAWNTHAKDFVDFVMTNHPESEYALYAAVYLPMRDGQPSEQIAAQIARHPKHAFSDQLRLLLMDYHQQAMGGAAARRDMRQAADEAEKVRTLASELIERSRSTAVRARAKEALERTPTRQRLMQSAQQQ